MSAKKSTKETRSKSWTFIIYPESAPDNWREVIDNFHIEWIESPLHNLDVTDVGEVKKQHYHILVCFGSLKSYEQVLEITNALNSPIPQRCHNLRSMVRYMAHLDNPDKAQYSVSDIISHGGIDASDFFKVSPSERYTLIKEILKYIRDNDVCEFIDIMDYAAEYRSDDWFPILCDNSAFVVDKCIKSNRHRYRDTKKEI